MMEVWRVLLLAHIVSHVHAVEICFDTCRKCNSESPVALSCKEQQVIHVLEKLVVCCSDADKCTATPPCVLLLPPSKLHPFCNGRELCNETVLVPGDASFASCSQPHQFQVNYECLSLSLTTNMCESEFNILGELHLATPGFPGQLSKASNPLCRCRVQGKNITVTALQMDLPFNGSSLTFSDVTDNRTLWSSVHAQSAPLYNSVLYTGEGLQTVDIVFNNLNTSDRFAWMEIRADYGMVRYGCVDAADDITPSLPHASLTTIPSTAPSANIDATTTMLSAQTGLSMTEAMSMSASKITTSSLLSSSMMATHDYTSRLSTNLGSTTTENTSATPSSSPGSSSFTFSSQSHIPEVKLRANCANTLNQCLQSQKETGPGGGTAQIIVPVLVSLVIIAAVIIICVFFHRRRAGQRSKSDDLERSAADNGDLYTRVTKSKPGVDKEPATPVKSAEKTVAESEADVPSVGGVHISGADNVAYVKDALGVGEITAHRSEGEQDAACGIATERKQTDRLKTDWRGHNDSLGYSEVEILEDASVPKLLEKNVSSQPQPENAKSDKNLADETVTSFNPSPQNNEEDARTESAAAEAPILKPELSLRSRPAEAHGNLPIMQDHTDGPLNHHYSEIDPVPKNNSTEPRTPAPPPTPHHYSDIELPDDIKIPDNNVFQGKKKSAKNPPHNYWVLEPQAEATTKPVAKKPGTYNVEIVPLKRSKSVEPHPSEKNALQSRGASERQRVFDASRGQHSAMDTPVPNPAQRSTTLSNAYADIDDDEVLALEPNSASRAPVPPPPLATAPTSSPGAPSHPAAAVAPLATPQDPERDSYGVALGYEPVEAGGNSPVKPLSSSEDRSVTASVSGLYEEIDKSKWDTATGANLSSVGAVADAGTLQGTGAVNGRLLPQDPATSSPDKKEDVLVYNILYESFQNAKKKTEK